MYLEEEELSCVKEPQALKGFSEKRSKRGPEMKVFLSHAEERGFICGGMASLFKTRQEMMLPDLCFRKLWGHFGD